MESPRSPDPRSGPGSWPQRILVYGVTGSGKTTLARTIGEATGLPWHSIDDEIGWLPGWVERPRDEQRGLVEQLMEGDAWVLDTVYSHWSDLVLPRTELIVALDYPRWRSLARLVRRTHRRISTRQEVCNGNVETWRGLVASDSILRWHFRSFASKRARITAWEAAPDLPPVVRLRSSAATRRWLAQHASTPR